LEVWRAIKSRRTVRVFNGRKVPVKIVRKLIDAARYAPSACNEQLWRFVVVESLAKRKEIVEKCGTSNLILNPPLVIFVFYHKSRFPNNIESASAAVQNILLAATEEGIATAWIGQSGKQRKLRKILNVPNDFELICEILVGYSDSTPDMPSRTKLDDILFFEKFLGGKVPYSHNPNKWRIKEISDYQKLFCRKTDKGRRVMVVNQSEIDFVRDIIKNNVPKNNIDMLSYDGTFLPFFQDNTDALLLNKETVDYLKSYGVGRKFLIDENLDLKKIKSNSYDGVTLIFKAERLPSDKLVSLYKNVYRILKKQGKFVMVYRNKYSLYGLIYFFIKKFFRDDIRKSGIFSFFGPFKPIKSQRKILREIGFFVDEKKRFIVPPVFSDYYNLLVQYIKTGGNTYLDSTGCHGFINRIILLKSKLTKYTPFFGSIGIIIARK